MRWMRLPETVRQVGAVVLAVAIAQAVLALLLAWPAGQPRLHGAPLAVAGPSGVARIAADTFEAASPGAWRISLLPDAAAARAAVLDRQVYGAVVIEDGGLRLLVASAASPTIAQQLGQAVDAVQARAQGTTLTVEDLAPSPRRDPRGAVPGLALLAVVGTSVAFGLVLWRRVRSVGGRLAGLIAFAALGGLASAAVEHVVLGSLTGSLLAESAVLGLTCLAAAAGTMAFAVVAGLAGAVIAAVIVVPVGYPVSGATSAPELIAAPWGTVGRYLPAGAGNTALRDVAFFHAAGAGGPLFVLAGWALIGLLVVAAPLVAPLLARRIMARATAVTPAASDSRPAVKATADAG